MTTPDTAVAGRIVDPAPASGSRLAKMIAEAMRRSRNKTTGKPRTMGFLPTPDKQVTQRGTVVVCRLRDASPNTMKSLIAAGADAVELDLSAHAATLPEIESFDAPVGLSLSGMTGAAYASWRDQWDTLAVDWITLDMESDPRFLGASKPARMLRLPISASIDTIRTVATDVVQLVTICPDESPIPEQSVATLLRIAFLCEAVRKPVLIDHALLGDADHDYLAAVQECGVGGIVLDAATPSALPKLLDALAG